MGLLNYKIKFKFVNIYFDLKENNNKNILN